MILHNTKPNTKKHQKNTKNNYVCVCTTTHTHIHIYIKITYVYIRGGHRLIFLI